MTKQALRMLGRKHQSPTLNFQVSTLGCRWWLLLLSVQLVLSLQEYICEGAAGSGGCSDWPVRRNCLARQIQVIVHSLLEPVTLCRDRSLLIT